MKLKSAVFATSVIGLLAGSTALAGEPGLLDQAIEENKGRPTPEAQNQQAEALVAKADRLTDQRSFNKALSLYEKAYRLSPSNQRYYVRLLVARRAAGVMTQQDREALALVKEQEAAEVNQVFRSVRLGMLQAKDAMRTGDSALAERKLADAGRQLELLPPYVDAAPYVRELKSLRSGLRARKGRMQQAAPHGLTLVDLGVEATDEPTETTEIASTPTTAAETGEIMNVDDVIDDHERHVYDRELEAALRERRAWRFLSNNEAALPPLRGIDMAFPADWQEKSARRAQYADGAIYKGKPFTGQDGQSYQTVIYDIGDLVHPVPNFYASYPGTVRMQRMQRLDRHALRWRSQIFNGYPEDLAAGLPLLHFFGGVDNNAVSSRTDPRETERVIATIERFLGR